MAPKAAVPHTPHANIHAVNVAVRSLQFGTLSWLFLFLLFASFGPGFRLDIAYLLSGGAILLGTLGIARADAAIACLRKGMRGHPGFALSGLAFSLSALLVGLAYSGVLGLLLLPHLAILTVPFLAMLLLKRSELAVCLLCGRRARPSILSWAGEQACPRCVRTVLEGGET